MKNRSFFSYVFGGFILALAMYFLAYGFPAWPQKRAPSLEEIKQAESDYSAGENAKTIFERKQAFNKALRAFQQLEQHYQPDYGNGQLYYDLGNTYYQLGEYSLAVYYYERALALEPGSSDALNNLNQALNKLGLNPSQADQGSLFHSVFFFHYFFSLPQRLTLFFAFTLLTFFLLSFGIWYGWRWISFPIALTGAASLLFLGSALYSRYLAPVQGVVIQGTTLYRDAGEEYAKVTDKPLSPGIKVEILDYRQEGKWLKILTPEGTLGYIKQDAVRIL
jgi:tetratricopeptide (TPR) repeat protein